MIRLMINDKLAVSKIKTLNLNKLKQKKIIKFMDYTTNTNASTIEVLLLFITSLLYTLIMLHAATTTNSFTATACIAYNYLLTWLFIQLAEAFELSLMSCYYGEPLGTDLKRFLGYDQHQMIWLTGTHCT